MNVWCQLSCGGAVDIIFEAQSLKVRVMAIQEVNLMLGVQRTPERGTQMPLVGAQALVS